MLKHDVVPKEQQHLLKKNEKEKKREKKGKKRERKEEKKKKRKKRKKEKKKRFNLSPCRTLQNRKQAVMVRKRKMDVPCEGLLGVATECLPARGPEAPRHRATHTHSSTRLDTPVVAETCCLSGQPHACTQENGAGSTPAHNMRIMVRRRPRRAPIGGVCGLDDRLASRETSQ